jgi:glycosyltransferase involved in cell wall biosynthesis
MKGKGMSTKTASADPKASLLMAANNALAPDDHRFLYSHQSKRCDVIFGLPKRPLGADDDHYVRLSFWEGVSMKDLHSFLQLLMFLARNRHSINFTHFLSTKLILVGPLLSRVVSIPSLITINGFGRVFSEKRPLYALLRPVYLGLLRISIQQCRKVLFQNHGDLEWLSGVIPGQKHKFQYIGSAVSFPAVREKNFSAKKLRVLLVTRLMPYKGIDDFISVAEALHGEDFEFVLVGPGSQGFEELGHRVSEYAARGIIDHKGRLSGDALLDEYRRAHVFYFPSSYAEGLARVMLEAGLSRMCPLAYDLVSNRDLIGPERGFIVSKGHKEEVIQLLRLLEKNALAYQRFVEENYTIEIYTRRMDETIAGMAELELAL